MEFPIVLCKKVIGRLWSLDKPRKWYKVTYFGLSGLRFPKGNSSRQTRYHLTLSTEGDTVGKVVWWSSGIGRLIELGRAIKITHRIYAKNKDLIPLYHCVIQYNGNFKTERYGDVRVVSLSSLMKLYQGFCLEGVQKYEDRDILESS